MGLGEAWLVRVEGGREIVVGYEDRGLCEFLEFSQESTCRCMQCGEPHVIHQDERKVGRITCSLCGQVHVAVHFSVDRPAAEGACP
jgi:hypothetical protein